MINLTYAYLVFALLLGFFQGYFFKPTFKFFLKPIMTLIPKIQERSDKVILYCKLIALAVSVAIVLTTYILKYFIDDWDTFEFAWTMGLVYGCVIYRIRYERHDDQ